VAANQNIPRIQSSTPTCAIRLIEVGRFGRPILDKLLFWRLDRREHLEQAIEAVPPTWIGGATGLNFRNGRPIK